jgi:hypothetical protein
MVPESLTASSTRFATIVGGTSIITMNQRPLSRS